MPNAAVFLIWLVKRIVITSVNIVLLVCVGFIAGQNMVADVSVIIAEKWNRKMTKINVSDMGVIGVRMILLQVFLLFCL